jgi:spore coat protein U-like protein
MTVTCTATGTGTATVTGTLTLSKGLSGTYAARTMRSGVNSLSYNVYDSPSDTQVFGDGTAGTSSLSGSGTVTRTSPLQVIVPIYGLVPPLQNVAGGAYSDTLIVTVTY